MWWGRIRTKFTLVCPWPLHGKQPCYYCGRTNHLPSTSWFIDSIWKERPHYMLHCLSPSHQAEPTMWKLKRPQLRVRSCTYLHLDKEIKAPPMWTASRRSTFADGDRHRSRSVISEAALKSLFPDKYTLQLFKTYTDQPIFVTGEISVVRCNTQSKTAWL